MSQMSKLLGVLLLGVYLMSTLLPFSAQAVETADSKGVELVFNSSVPSSGIITLQLEELWRTGAEDDELFFGSVPHVLADDRGQVYILDSQQCCVRVFSGEGRLVQTLGGPGEGPGEVRAPRRMILLPDGKVGLCDWYPAKVALIEPDGTPNTTFTLGSSDPTAGGFCILVSAGSRDGQLAFGTSEMTATDNPMVQERLTSLSLYNIDGQRANTMLSENYVFNLNLGSFSETKYMDWCGRRFDVAPNGEVYSAAERDNYRIQVFGKDGQLKRIIEREINKRQRTDTEFRFFKTLIEGLYSQLPFEVKADIEKDAPPIALFPPAVQVRSDGKLWILSSDGVINQPDGVMLTYDVFNEAGSFEQQVQIACEGDTRHDVLFLVDSNKAVLIKNFMDAMNSSMGGSGSGDSDNKSDIDSEDRQVEIVCYRLF